MAVNVQKCTEWNRILWKFSSYLKKNLLHWQKYIEKTSGRHLYSVRTRSAAEPPGGIV